MQKIFTIFLSLLVASSMLSGCAYEANDEKTSEDVETVKLYDSNIDYMDIMIKSAAYRRHSAVCWFLPRQHH